MDDRRPASQDRVLTRGCYALLAFALFCALAVPASAKLSVARKKQLALTAYDDAERMRQTFRDKTSHTRTEYQRLIDAYRKVYYLAPNSIKAEPAIVAVAELLADEGRAFHDEKLSRNAIGQYEFLRREYPGSASRVAALFAVGQIYGADLGDVANSKKTFQEFVRRYPRSELIDEAKQALQDLESGKSLKKPEVAKQNAPKSTEAVARETSDAETRRAASAKKSAEPEQTAVSKKSAKLEPAPDVSMPARSDLPPAVRAAAEKADAAVDGKSAKLESKKPVETVPAPRDRKQVDASPAASSDKKLETAKQDVAAPDASHRGKLPLVTGIRHWSTPDYTRIAVDLEQEVEYEVGRVAGPDRIFFDLHGTKLAPSLMPGKEYAVEDGLLKKVRVAQFQLDATRIVLDLGDVADYQAFLLPNPYRLIVDIHGKKKPASAKANTPATNTSVPTTVAEKSAEPPADAKTSVPPPRNETASKTTAPRTTNSPASSRPATDTKIADAKLKTDATIETVASAKPDAKSSDDGDDDTPPAKPATPARAPRSVMAREAKPTAAGDRSLIRALGLKIGRIVVDAGHGGHDTGTIGPTGLQEKDLVLDVALRLGKLLETRMGADLVYTRDDDTFIPLETRTAIANREQADLFISVHANSSRDPAARGVETYYLNFTTSADALDVAARENAVSDTSIHELQDLVKKIALKEKVEESKEFAADVQQSLRSGLSGRGSNMRDRGVKKAPFIVLIGANMPSILA